MYINKFLEQLGSFLPKVEISSLAPFRTYKQIKNAEVIYNDHRMNGLKDDLVENYMQILIR